MRNRDDTAAVDMDRVGRPTGHVDPAALERGSTLLPSTRLTGGQRTHPQRVILFQRGAAGLPRRAPFGHRPRFYSDWPYSAMQDRYI
jgi:hypothetical protein